MDINDPDDRAERIRQLQIEQHDLLAHEPANDDERRAQSEQLTRIGKLLQALQATRRDVPVLRRRQP